MYSIYQIYQSEKLVYSTYHTINPDFADTTKLDLLLNSPITPYTLVDSYFKQPDTFSIHTIKSGIDNALEASEALLELVNTTNIRANRNDNSDTVEDLKINLKPKKTRTKKAQQSKKVS